MSRCGECKLGCNEEGALYCEENLGYEQCIDRLQDVLYVADRPQGTYTDSNDNVEWYAIEATCNSCGESWMGKRNFCPNCGREMKGATDETTT